MKNILCIKNTVLPHHEDKMCFLPNCRYHNILICNNKDLLPKLDAFCFNNQQWTVFIHFSSTASVAKMLSEVDNSLIICRRQFISTNKTEEWFECQASRKKGSWGRSRKNICWAFSRRLNRGKQVDHSLQTVMNKLKRLNLIYNR